MLLGKAQYCGSPSVVQHLLTIQNGATSTDWCNFSIINDGLMYLSPENNANRELINFLFR